VESVCEPVSAVPDQIVVPGGAGRVTGFDCELRVSLAR
jgi:hypothetical protein